MKHFEFVPLVMAVTYLIVDTEQNKIAAYFSLLNDKVAYNPESKGIWNRINRHIHNTLIITTLAGGGSSRIYT